MSSDPNPNQLGPTPQDDVDRIRLKRLAKLQNATSTDNPGSPKPAAPSPQAASPKPKPRPSPAPKITQPPAQSVPPPITKKRVPATPVHLDLPTWEHETIEHVFNVTLDKEVAEGSRWEIVWLKGLALELEFDDPAIQKPPPLTADLADRLLIARLEIDPQAMSDDLEYLSVIASLPAEQTIFEYLVGCWKRGNRTRSELLKKGFPPAETQQAVILLDKLQGLVISYTGLILQESEMFPQPSKREVGPVELLGPLLSLSSLSTPLLSTPISSPNQLSPAEVEPLLQDMVNRFEPDNELGGVLGPVVHALLFHESLFRREGFAGSDSGWRRVIAGLEALVSIKQIAVMITRLDEWNPKNATAASIERVSLMGPLCRLNVFGHEWPTISETYFGDLDRKNRADVESSTASLRGTLKSLQNSLFQIFNALVRGSPESREAVLQYFSRVINLNVKRAGLQVGEDTIASDSFMVNLQTVLYRLAEPFMDANYTKIDRIDPLYFAHSTRLDIKEETRIKATSEEVTAWQIENSKDAVPPNFISEIFYLSLAMFHFGYQRTIQEMEDFAKHADELQRHIDRLENDINWQGTPFQQRTEVVVNQAKHELAKVKSTSYSFTVQLLDPEHVFRSMAFTTFISTWVVRFVDPKKKHPNPLVELPLPRDVPIHFRVLPEFVLEDVIDYFLFIVRHSPNSLELSGKNELVIFTLTFLTSTWYIKNPFLKAKLVEMLFYGILGYGHERTGVLGHTLNSHPLALKHLMSSLMSFYVEVEQTGASSQFYDKFNARRNIAYIFKVIWNNPAHRQALDDEAKRVDNFVRFVNLMINDVTYLMDESLNELTQIHNIETEMENTQEWEAKSLQYRREREGTLRSLERHASGYITLGRSTVDLLKIFTAETKSPFMMPEIVGKLAAMLDYNLDALAGPKCRDLKVKNPEKYKFDPRALLSDIVQVFLNLSDEEEFAGAVAEDGRSYRKELFDGTVEILRRRTLKTEDEIEKLLVFVQKVENLKAMLEEEEDLGEVPDEFLDALLYTVMKDPVTLPSSRAVVDRSTIKSHLLSDSKDPFNRAPLTIEEVIPNTELKARIDEFLTARHAERRARKMDTE
ncbi:hypothetical protein BDM02DRAFT_3272627 [Thelephora ganbajun]|uniref:Uncharacterized protein n=1 Tax=Thelephora ganbajun TaxID=370292 RepID=A0ACB6Z313_THEGA|nr:hypothetical protein BDM02DRAFT_3272627 [Thelephora ganbajun]